MSEERWARGRRGLQSLLRGAAPLAATAAAAGVLVSACGGGPASPAAAHAGSQASHLLAFSACIRAHGIPGFPDPQPGGGYARHALNPFDGNSPRFQAAEQACMSLAIASGFVQTPAELQKHIEQELAESACMRKHGVPDMPNPDAQGQITFPPGGPNPSQPQFQAAHKHCAYLNP
jgi:hypothetical protein